MEQRGSCSLLSGAGAVSIRQLSVVCVALGRCWQVVVLSRGAVARHELPACLMELAGGRLEVGGDKQN
ncbi:hypothetical protein E2C01_001733 [Portunus trituberculatus]|uniref:Uncharacterized protein n=1 Tax=Portunus trituberculatus TaxID=210409 RepID=A0A5B7CI26_PORTR|nr:hypothetical protein [Portunus trituberculatus]